MTTGGEVLFMLCPNSRWTIYGNDWDNIVWEDSAPITKEQFETGFSQYDAWKAQQDAQVVAARAAAEAKLAALGLTAEDLKALGL